MKKLRNISSGSKKESQLSIAFLFYILLYLKFLIQEKNLIAFLSITKMFRSNRPHVSMAKVDIGENKL